MTRSARRRSLHESATFYLFMLPAIAFIIVFIVYPTVHSLILPFFQWKGYGEAKFVGLDNFKTMFTEDEYFWTALKNSIFFSVSGTVGTVLIGFVLAVLIDLKIRFWRLYRFFFFLTVSVSVVVTGLLWVKILDPFGLLNTVLGYMNLAHMQKVWLGDGATAMPAIILTAIWQYSGFTMIFFLAGMQSIDEEIFESAMMDGASKTRTVFSITLPLLKNVFSVVTMLQLIFSFKVFDQVWVMTKGGPAGATEVLGTHLYTDAFRLIRFGYASVIAFIMFLVAIVFSSIYIRISGYTRTVRPS
jgi:ABC-type sugar transport system permease subunit